MPPLKAIEQAEFGGVDSRSNPINMPMKRFLMAKNWVPRPDGHLELREGYTQLTPDPYVTDGAVHSITSYFVATRAKNFDTSLPDPVPLFDRYTPCVFFWRGTTPYLRRLSDGDTVIVPVDGDPIASSQRFQYALGKNGSLYMHNGTDMKFFDGVKLRDIGLPIMSTAGLAGVNVEAGFSAPAASDLANASMTLIDDTSGLGGWWTTGQDGYLFYGFFDTTDNSFAPTTAPIGDTQYPLADPATPLDKQHLQITPMPDTPASTTLGLISISMTGSAGPPTAGACFVNYRYRTHPPAAPDPTYPMPAATMTAVNPTTVNVHCPGHGLALSGVDPARTGLYAWYKAVPYVFCLELVDPTNLPAWENGGPFVIDSVVDADNFTFKVPSGSASDYAAYSGTVNIILITAFPQGSTTLGPFDVPFSPWRNQGQQISRDGKLLVPFSDSPNSSLLPASTIGGAQPGYQFYVAIFNPYTGHVGNRTPIGPRLANKGDSTVIITGLPAIGGPFSALREHLQWGNGSELERLRGSRMRRNIRQGKVAARTVTTFSAEWYLLIGRTGDGGEVPYAVIDTDGNWVWYNPTRDAGGTVTLQYGQIDGNSELPFTNFIPPAFANFWREGDRQCGSVANQPFVYRSAAELDDTTGIFVGDPAEAWDPSKIETFPSAHPIIGGFGNMQESWAFSTGEVGVLSELSGEVVWNGPYNFGIAGPFAFDTGWQSLPFWVTHDKQLCTMMPGSSGPMAISTEYEAALLAKIGDLSQTEVVYFLDSVKMIEVLRIKCVDQAGNPFVIIHDFNLRDDLSPYGQGYEDDYQAPLNSTVFTMVRIRDANDQLQVWAGASDGNLYQFYSGGDDFGTPFTAESISLRYLGGERTACKTLEWYGDENIQWYIIDKMVGIVSDYTQWIELSFEMRPVPGDVYNAHWMADLQRPEMTHCYLWARLESHAVDALDPAKPMALSDPPHLPLETYGRLYFAAPILGDSRGR
jgi:hypothetical protein